MFTEGVLVAEDGKYLGGDCKTADYDLPNTVDLPQITGPSPRAACAGGYTGDTIRVNVMVSEDGNRILRHVEPVELPVRDGVVDISGDPTLVFVCCANRYGRGGKTIAVYRDFGLRAGALASTIRTTATTSPSATTIRRTPSAPPRSCARAAEVSA